MHHAQGGVSDSICPWLPVAANQRRVPCSLAFDASIEGAKIEGMARLLTGRANGYFKHGADGVAKLAYLMPYLAAIRAKGIILTVFALKFRANAD
jgi:hypothetical protein